MTTAKPHRGPDSDHARHELLVRLQLIKGEIDGVLGSNGSLHIGVMWSEVHGAEVQPLGAFTARSSIVVPGSGSVKLSAPDSRLEALREIHSAAYLLQAYGDFADRGWLRQRLAGGLTANGSEYGIEAVHFCDFRGIELQRFVREAVLAVARTMLADRVRRDRAAKANVKDLLLTMADALKRDARERAVGPARRTGASVSPFSGRTLSRRGFGLVARKKSVLIGDPQRSVTDSCCRDAIAEAVKQKLLIAHGTTSDRRYEITAKGWALAHATVTLGAARAMMMRGPVTVTFEPAQVRISSSETRESISLLG